MKELAKIWEIKVLPKRHRPVTNLISSEESKKQGTKKKNINME